MRSQRKTRRELLERHSRIESLETRCVMAVAGPELISLNPNAGALFDTKNLNVLNTAPQELTFRFNADSDLDPASLAGIQITRTGPDRSFDVAHASSDFQTNGKVIIDFNAANLGVDSNDVVFSFTKSNLGVTAGVPNPPLINVVGKKINVVLNADVTNTSITTAQQLVTALNADSKSLLLVNARLRADSSGVIIGGTQKIDIPSSPSPYTLSLAGANAATVTSNFNVPVAAGSTFPLGIRFDAVTPGSAGNDLVVRIVNNNSTNPIATVSGKTITVSVNSGTTAAQIVNAVNSTVTARGLIVASVEIGNPNTVVGSQIAVGGTSVRLGGVDDIVVTPGYRGLGDQPGEVIVRFAEPLPDDLYRVEIFGVGNAALGTTAVKTLAPVQNFVPRIVGTDRDTINFKLDLGSQVIAVVPQPVDIPSNPSNPAQKVISSRRDEIVVYFNDDDLATQRVTTTGAATDPLVVNPTFYELIFTNGDATNTNATATYNFRTATGDVKVAYDAVEVVGGVAQSRNGITVQVNRAAPGSGLASPQVVVTGRLITVTLNDNATAQNLLDAINGNAASAALIRARIVPNSGLASTNIAAPNDMQVVPPVVLGDVVFNPTSVTYDPVTDSAILKFAKPLEQLSTGTGTYRLRIGTNENLPLAPASYTPGADPGSSFLTANDLSGSGVTDLSSQGIIISATITDSSQFPLDMPGAIDEPGHRDIPGVESHYGNFRGAVVDVFQGIESFTYNFRDIYGHDSQGNPLHNLITENQKQRTREIFDLYARYLGIKFVETTSNDIQPDLVIVTGDMGVLGVVPGAIGVEGANCPIPPANPNSYDENGVCQTLAVMSPVSNPDDVFGGTWFTTAMHEIGHALGLGHSFELPDQTIMGSEPSLSFGIPSEQVFPGDADIVHGQFLHRPEGRDIDLYKFTVTKHGTLSAETLAERQLDASSLNTMLRLYRETPAVAASAVSDLGTNNRIQIKFEATSTGTLGNKLTLHFTRSDRGVGNNSIVSVTDNDLYIDLNTNAVTPTLGKDLINAINASSAVTGVKASLVSSIGSDLENLVDGTVNPRPIALRGGSELKREVVAQNDDYYSNDSFLEMDVEPGTYYIGVSASGNGNYDPAVSDSGFGGLSEGPYQLRLNFHEQVAGDRILRDLDQAAITLPGTETQVSADKVLDLIGDGRLFVDGQQFTITDRNGVTRTFEFNTVGSASPGVTPIQISASSTADQVSTAIVDTINTGFSNPTGSVPNAGFAVKDGARHIKLTGIQSFNFLGAHPGIDVSLPGTPFDGNGDGTPGGIYNFWFQTNSLDRVLEFTGPNTSLVDGQTITVTDTQGTTLRFEFDTNGVWSPANKRVDISLASSAEKVATAFKDAVNLAFNKTLVDYASPSLPPTVPVNRVTLRNVRNVVLSTGFLGAEVLGRTIFVDRSYTGSSDGSMAAPFNRISTALTNTQPGDIVRVLGNGGVDGNLTTTADNMAYEIGRGGPLNAPLSDGTTLVVPQGVTMMVDAGAIFKMSQSHISIGSTTAGTDRSAAAFQVLGTPNLLQASHGSQSGAFLTDSTGKPVPGSVYFTSYNDESLGIDSNALATTPSSGDWGGILYRSDLDHAQARFDYENQGIFLNYVNHADMRYGGGKITINSVQQVIDPISMIESRPTVSHNTITRSADAAISADPNSFEETNFHSPRFQPTTINGGYTNYSTITPFTSDYQRVGPEIHGNRILNNSINGLFVNVQTLPGTLTTPMTVAGRFDDTDIVHVITENLVIQGSAGGLFHDLVRPALDLVTVNPHAGGNLASGTYTYKITFVDEDGNESPTSIVTVPRSATTNTALGQRSIQLDQLPPVTGPYVARRVYRGFSTDPLTAPTSYEFVAQLDGSVTSFVDSGKRPAKDAVLDERTNRYLGRLDGRLSIDPGTVVKIEGSRIELTHGAQLFAEGREGHDVVFTSRLDDRYGGSGTFDTNNDGLGNAAQSQPGAGNWGGISAGVNTQLSLDHAFVTFAGGVTKVEGSFANFNAVEIRQADARITNSIFENNDDGQGGQAPADRFGRGTNAAATIFVRGAQPIIVDSIIRDGAGAAISIDVNSLNAKQTVDYGRATYRDSLESDDILEGYRDNSGPLVRANRLANNAVNGMNVRGGTMTTEGIWDDTDIVHVLQGTAGTVNIPDFHTFGGLTLRSSPTESLVIKLSGANAGFTATGRPLDIEDRIGGTLHVIGQPGFPVIFTSLNDASVGAGFTPDGLPQTDTNNGNLNGGNLLPTGPEVNNGTLIDNDVATNIVGHFQAQPAAGGGLGIAGGGATGATVQGASGLLLQNQNFIFEFLNFVDPGSNGGAINLRNSTITQPPTLLSNDLVESRGTFNGANGVIQWQVQSRFDDGVAKFINTITFSSNVPFGNLRFINYLDQNVLGANDDILYTKGTPGQPDFRVYTLDNPERIGFSQGGAYTSGPELLNATYDGWAADQFSSLRTNIIGAGTTYSINGNVNTGALPPFADPNLGTVNGPRDVTSAMAWTLNPNATTATITSFLELVAVNPGTLGAKGDWRSIRIDEFANDRNVAAILEQEPATANPPGTNATTNSAQYIGILAPNEMSGDDVKRLGFQMDGFLNAPQDVDIFSFDATAGTEVWFDIDKTAASLDTVLELITVTDDGLPLVVARSNDSYWETRNSSLLYRNPNQLGLLVNPLQKLNPLYQQYNLEDPFYNPDPVDPKDNWTTNLRDAGMRVVLPGTAGSSSTYYVRVRSNTCDQAGGAAPCSNIEDVSAGLTSGVYQLQVRLREMDEIPGSTVRQSDIRYATNGIEVFGQPIHSPLLGEAGEVPTVHNSAATSQPLGNILNTDRSALSVAGNLATAAEVDWYSFTVNHDSIEFPGRTVTKPNNPLAAIFDIDYADGMVRPDLSIFVFDSANRLIFASTDSNVGDDRANPTDGSSVRDLYRGTVGALDPSIGTVELPEGRYSVAIAGRGNIPTELSQLLVQNPANSLTRLEPLHSINRIAEDHIGAQGGQTAQNPNQLTQLIDANSAVPYFLGDVQLMVSRQHEFSILGDPSVPDTQLMMVNPYTGRLESIVNTGLSTSASFNGDIGDIALRQDGNLFAFSRSDEITRICGLNDAEAGNYLQINTGNGTITNLGDDRITTYETDFSQPNLPPIIANFCQGALVGYGVQFDATTFGYINNDTPNTQRLLAIGSRGDSTDILGNTPFGSSLISRFDNLLYQFDPQTGVALRNSGIPTWFDGDRAPVRGAAATDATELGEVIVAGQMTIGPNAGATSPAAANYGPGTLSISNIQDAGRTSFAVDDGVNQALFEFDAGPEVSQQLNQLANKTPINSATVRDGYFFTLDPDQTTANDEVYYQIDTGTVLQVTATTSAGIVDGQTFTVQTPAGLQAVFEFDSDKTVGSGTTKVDITTNLNTAGIATQIANAINNSPISSIVTAQAANGRVTLTGDSFVSIGPGRGLIATGTNGVAPILRAVDGSAIQDGQQFQLNTTSTGAIGPTTFEFDSGYVFQVPAAGEAGITDGSTFRILNLTGLGNSDVTFEFDKPVTTPVTLPNVQILLQPGDSQDVVANKIVSAINAAGLNLGALAKNLGNGVVKVGGSLFQGVPQHAIATNTSELSLIGQLGQNVNTGYVFQVPASGGTVFSENGGPKTFNIQNATTGANDTFEFESGYAMQVPLAGAAAIQDTDKFTITTGANTQTFEFDTGYVLSIVAGGLGFTDGMRFTLTNNGTTVVFELNNTVNGPAGISGDKAVDFAPTDSRDQIGTAIANAILSQGPLGLAASYLGGGRIYVGGSTSTVLTLAAGPNLLVGSTPGVTPGNVPIVINPATGTQNILANQIVNAITPFAVGLQVTPSNLGAGAVQIGGGLTTTITNNTGGRLNISGGPGVAPGNIAINVDPLNDSQNTIANKVVQAILSRPLLQLSPTNLGLGRIVLGGTPSHTITDNSPINLVGPTGARAPQLIPYDPSSLFTANQTALAMQTSILNASQQPQTFGMLDGSLIADGTTFTVIDGGVPITFEMDDVTVPPQVGSIAGVKAGNIRVPYVRGNPNAQPNKITADTAPVIAQQLQASIIANVRNTLTVGISSNVVFVTETGLGVDIPVLVNDLVVVNGGGITFTQGTAPITQVKNPNGTNIIQIQVEETDHNGVVATKVANTVQTNGIYNFAAGGSGTRLNFPNIPLDPVTGKSYLTADRVDTSGIPVWAEILTSKKGTLGTGVNAIPFRAEDTNQTIANSIRNAINQAFNGTVTATITGNPNSLTGYTVRLSNGEYVSTTAPFTTQGAGPGGYVRGMAIINGQIFTVTDKGGLYRVDIPNFLPVTTTRPPTVVSTYVRTSANDLAGITFAGLTAGPKNVENGRYANMLFGITPAGRMYAFDTNGVLQPIFMNGQTSVQLNCVDVVTGQCDNINGLAFSNLDVNLWHDTVNRSSDAGHGINSPFDGSRGASAGGTSMYFGFEDPSGPTPNDGGTWGPQTDPGNRLNYNFAGGAHGTVVTNEFSLKGYAAADQPVLYFNYFSGIEVDGTVNDAFRVFIAGDDGNWQPLAANAGAGQPLHDNSGNWRQARVPLAAFAGQENLRLRFDFSTAGDTNVGDTFTTGSELRVVEGAKTRDGDIFVVDGQNYEIEMGITLSALPGGEISDASTFTLTDAAGVARLFEFDSDSKKNFPASTLISYASTDSANQIANKIRAALTAPYIVHQNRLDPSRLNVEGAVSVTTSTKAPIFFNGAVGVTGTNVPVRLFEDTPRQSVSNIVKAVLEEAFVSQVMLADIGSKYVDGMTFTLDDGSTPVTYEFDSGYVLNVPAVGGAAIADGDTFSFDDGSGGHTMLFEFDNDPIPGKLNNPTAMRVPFTTSTSQVALAQSIRDAIRIRVAAGTAAEKTALGLMTNPQVVVNFGVQVGGNPNPIPGNAVNYVTSNPALSATAARPGVAAGNQRIFYTPGTLNDARVMAQLIGNAINASPQAGSITTSVAAGSREIIFNRPNLSLIPVVLTNGTLPAPTPLILQRNTAVLNPGTVDVVKQDEDLLRIIGHVVNARGPFGLQNTPLAGDQTGSVAVNTPFGDPYGDLPPLLDDRVGYNHPVTGQRNNGEGVYFDDIIIGFAERGELVTASAGTTTFTGGCTAAICTGAYQLEVRPGTEFRDVAGGLNPLLGARSFDTNDRFDQQATLTIPDAADIREGTTFTISDGLNTVTFEYDDINTPVVVKQGNIAIPYDPQPRKLSNNKIGPEPANVVAVRVRDIINGSAVQSQIKISADTSDSAFVATQKVGVTSTSAKVNLYGNAIIGGNVAYVQYDDRGDKNSERDQGQILIEGNRITNSNGFGILVDNGVRSAPQIPLAGALPHQGAQRNLVVDNTERLVAGVTVINNVSAFNTLGGIRFAGEATPAGAAPAAVPFGRIVNNTIYGTRANDVGIDVRENAGPTLLNNIIANVATAITVDASSLATTVIGTTLYQNAGGAGLGDFPIVLAATDPLFVDGPGGNFNLKANSLAIDSSIDSLPDRFVYSSVRAPLGIPVSPIIAPRRDVTGQLRVDDPSVSTPGGQGSNVFIDRGAVDRADFIGPTATLILPLDNDADGLDVDPSENVVQLNSGVLPYFSLVLADGDGTGPDVKTIQPNVISVTQDGKLLRSGVDYIYGFDETSRTLQITPQSGIWKPDSVFQITLNNRDRYLVDPFNGTSVKDGDRFQVTDNNNAVVTYEYESGYQLSIPQTLRLQVPGEGAGAGGVVDGDRFTLNDGVTSLIFEFDRDSNATPGTIPISFTLGATQDTIVALMISAIQTSGLSFVPRDLGNGAIHLGSKAGQAITLPVGSKFTQSGVAGGLVDGNQFSIRDGLNFITFEFDDVTNGVSNGVTSGTVPIDFSLRETNDEIANRVAAIVRSANVRLDDATNVGNGVIHLGGTTQVVTKVGISVLTLTGTPGVTPSLSFTVPVTGGAAIADGQRFTISKGTQTWTFEFDSNSTLTNAANIPIRFSSVAPITSQDTLANDIVDVISRSTVGLKPAYLGNGLIDFNETAEYVVDFSLSSNLLLTGIAGGALLVPFDAGTTEAEMALNLINALNAQNAVQVPAAGGGVGGVLDGEQFSITRAGRTVRFEFDDNNNVAFGSIPIRFSAISTQYDVTTAIVNAVASAGLGLSPVALTAGSLSFNTLPGDVLNLTRAPHLLPTSASTVTGRVQPGSDSAVIIDGAKTATGTLPRSFLPAIRDLAGNALRPNQRDGQTQFTIVMPNSELDYGDAPDPSYPTFFANDGARHVVFANNPIYLGNGAPPNTEVDARVSSAGVTGSAAADPGDDGITFLGPLNSTVSTPINVKVTGSGIMFLDAWIDWNGDGDWDDPQEQVFSSVQVFGPGDVPQGNNLSIQAPANASPPPGSPPRVTYARFRLSVEGGLDPTGLAVGGEVEDYEVQIVPGQAPIAVDDSQYNTNANAILSINGAAAAINGILANDSDPDGGVPHVEFVTSQKLNGSPAQVTLPSGAIVTMRPDGGFDYYPNNAFDFLPQGVPSTDAFTYRTADVDGLVSNIATVTINIMGVNDKPVPSNNSYQTSEDSTFNGNLILDNTGSGVDTDPDVGDVPTLVVSKVNGIPLIGTGTVITLPSNATVTASPDGTFTYDPSASNFNALAIGENGTETFTYEIVDALGATNIATVTIRVVGANDAPIPVANAYTTDDNTPFNGNVLTDVATGGRDTDPDTTDTLVVLRVNNAAANIGVPIRLNTGATLIVNADGTFNYDPTTSPTLNALRPGQTANDTFQYSIGDIPAQPVGSPAQTLSTPVAVTITVTGVNDSPIATPNTYAATTNAIRSGNLITDNTGAGVDSDPEGDAFVVDAVNGVTTAVGQNYVILSGATVRVNANGSFTYDASTSATLLALRIGQSATDIFTYTIRDARGATATATATFNISGVNDAPVATNNAYQTQQLVSFAGNFRTDDTGNGVDRDPDTGDTFNITNVAGQAVTGANSIINLTNGVLTVNNTGAFTYLPNATTAQLALGQSLNDSFTYVVRDSLGLTSTATVTIRVDGVNDIPIAIGNVYTTTTSNVLTGNVITDNTGTGRDSDPDIGDIIRVTTVNGVAASVGTTITTAMGATLRVNQDGSFSYDSSASPALVQLIVGQSAVDSFTYSLTDNSNANSNTATVTITINGTNDAPRPTADVLTTDEQTVVNTNLITSNNGNGPDSDPDNDPLTIVQINGQPVTIGVPIVLSTNATLTVTSASGNITYDPRTSLLFDSLKPGQSIGDSFTYTVTDAGGLTATASVTLTVNGVNDAPRVTNDTAATDQGIPVTINVLANDSDVDGTLTASSVTIVPGSGPANAVLVVNPNGSIRFTPTDDTFTGNVSFRYTVRDNLNAISPEATVNVTVRSVPSPWQNQTMPLDVNDDKAISPLDALIIINEINSHHVTPPSGKLPTPVNPGDPRPPSYYDVNNDRFVSSIDALIVINYLNSQSGGEGERAVANGVFTPVSNDVSQTSATSSAVTFASMPSGLELGLGQVIAVDHRWDVSGGNHQSNASNDMLNTLSPVVRPALLQSVIPSQAVAVLEQNHRLSALEDALDEIVGDLSETFIQSSAADSLFDSWDE